MHHNRTLRPTRCTSRNERYILTYKNRQEIIGKETPKVSVFALYAELMCEICR